MDLIALRTQIHSLLAAGDADGALRTALAAAQENTAPECWRAVHSILHRAADALAQVQRPEAEVRIALAGSMTLDNLVPHLSVACRLAGLDPKIHVCPFGQFQLDLRNPASSLFGFDPHVTILVAELAAVSPALPPFESTPSAEEACTQALEEMRQLMAAHRRSATGHLLVHTFITPASSSLGIFESTLAIGVADFHRQLNAGLSRLARETEGVYLVDLDHLVAGLGREAAINRRMQYLARMPVSERLAQQLAHRYVAHVRAMRGQQRKCLVVDLDNTLWGGILGEDGLTGLKLGDDPPGNVYRDIQLAIRHLYDRGVILAIASKNNPDDVAAVFTQRREMILGREHFAAMEIGWHDKATSLRRIAQSLDIGLDSLVFLDDSPQERHLVGTQLPEVLVLPFPGDVSLLPDQLLTSGCFDTLTLTRDDRHRGQMYAQRLQRQEAQSATANLDEFLHSLGIRLGVRRAERADVARVAQLTQRTNQFNLTTTRYTEEQIASFVQDPAWEVLLASVSDRFGEEGTIGVAIVHSTEAAHRIDTFLMSCRVLGRGIEQALLGNVVQICRQRGPNAIHGWYLPTRKNAQVKDFYAKFGFRAGTHDGEAIEWVLDTHSTGPSFPAWIHIEEPAPEKDYTNDEG